MKIYIGADHNGYHLKSEIQRYLEQRGHQVIDEGNDHRDAQDDFPIFAARVVNALRADSQFDPYHSEKLRGVLICGSGQGMAIAANRFKGIRAGLIYNLASAKSTRHDEDSNIAALPAELFDDPDSWKPVVDAWLDEPFAGAARFKRRNRELDELS